LSKYLEIFSYIVVGKKLTNLACKKPGLAMKRAATVLFALVAIGLVFCIEYEMATWFGLGLLLIAGSGLVVIAIALACAPLGCDSHGAFYICRSPRRVTHFPHHRFCLSVRVWL
jgi:hypothetical protein